MARLNEEEIACLEKKTGFITVTHRVGYEEKRISVNDLIKDFRELKKELENAQNETNRNVSSGNENGE